LERRIRDKKDSLFVDIFLISVGYAPVIFKGLRREALIAGELWQRFGHPFRVDTLIVEFSVPIDAAAIAFASPVGNVIYRQEDLDKIYMLDPNGKNRTHP
jgi:hypothetical protein